MSLYEFKLPDIGEGVMEGEIVSWLVEPGQSVQEDEPMVEVMTDKATVTIGAPKTGRVSDLRAAVGEVVMVGAVIVTLETNGAARPSAAAEGGTRKHAAPPPPEQFPEPVVARPAPVSPPQVSAQQASGGEGPAATAVGDIRESLPGSSYFSDAAAGRARPVASSGHFTDKPLATPATRKLARDLGVDLRYVRPTGSQGRVSKHDVRGFVGDDGGATTPGTTAAPSAGASNGGATSAPIRAVGTIPGATSGAVSARTPQAIEAPTAEQRALEDRRPFVGMRRKIAERLQRSTQTAAHFTFVEECDVGALQSLRARLGPTAEASGAKLTFLPFIVKAVVSALRRHPVLNSALDERTNELVTRRYYNIGIAASTDNGLMVPVIKDADKKTILEIAKEITALGTAAKEGTIASSDLSGSTFTITSLGRQGGLFATPVLNFPEVGILGVHQIKQRPVVRDGQIVIGEIMLLSLSFDHRIVDGHVGAAFAYDIIATLEDPDRLFLEMA